MVSTKGVDDKAVDSSSTKPKKEKIRTKTVIKYVYQNSPPPNNPSIIKRIKSGITNLDPLMEGGFREKSITMVSGDAGSGKTIFAMQFLYEGLKNGECCIYLTFEEKKERLYENMAEFGWDFAAFEKDKKLFFLEYNPEQVKALIEEGGGTINQIISSQKISRLVIDSIASFSMLYQDQLSRKEAGLALFELINAWGCTAVLTSGTVSRKSEPESSLLEFEVDGVILLYYFKEKGKRMRAIEILKMRGTKHGDATMGLEITNHGLAVKSSQIITSV